MHGYVSKTTFARIYGCRPSYVSKLNAEKRLVLDEAGVLVNVEASLRLIEASRDLSKTGVRERWAAYRDGKKLDETAGTEAAPPPPATSDPVEPRDITAPPANGSAASGRGSTYHDARAEREFVEAQLKKLELRERLGEVAELAPMLRAVEEMAGSFAAALDELPDRLAGLVAIESDVAAVHTMLAAEVARIRAALAAQAQAIARQGALTQ